MGARYAEGNWQARQLIPCTPAPRTGCNMSRSLMLRFGLTCARFVTQLGGFRWV